MSFIQFFAVGVSMDGAIFPGQQTTETMKYRTAIATILASFSELNLGCRARRWSIGLT
jgi:hypothetical protein